MDGIIFVLEALVVLGCILIGTRVSGVGVGLWGGLGVFVLVFVFREPPGEPPAAAIAIILAVASAGGTPVCQNPQGLIWQEETSSWVLPATDSRLGCGPGGTGR